MPLRLTVVSETFFPQINGVSRTLDKLVGHCRSQGDQVQLIVPRYADPGDRNRQGEIRIELPGGRLPFYREIVLPLVRPRDIRLLLQGFGSQVVHIATEGPLGWAALRAAARLGLPTVSSYHTNFPQYFGQYRAGWLTPLAWRYLRWFHNATRTTFCPTPSIRDLLQQKGFHNLAIWSRGVDSRLFHPGRRNEALRLSLGFAPQERVLVYLGRLAAEKNIEMLLSAWQQLSVETPCRLLVIGDGPLRRKVESAAGEKAVFVGYRQGEELAGMLAAGDLMIFPSLTDTFGNVMLEAMASGLPVVAFNAPGPKDVVQDGTTGRLAPDISARSLARVTAEMIRDVRTIREMGRQARTFAQTQSWSDIMENIRGHYLTLSIPRRRCEARREHADQYPA
jgi:glycosyltransferase involved in cell wall biosynthesis